MKAKIYVNRQIVERNKKMGRCDPPISVRTYKGVRRVHGVVLNAPSVLIYSPDTPLPSGATVWLETNAKEVNFPE